MSPDEIIQELSRNKAILHSQLIHVSPEKRIWRPDPKHWCLLEVVCHLHDEEREDFRARIKHMLESPDLPLKPIRPSEWVTSREYMIQDYDEMVEQLIYQRQVSIDWLETLSDVHWDDARVFPLLGSMSARTFLVNWLAHDYIHIRQINRLHYRYHEMKCEESSLGYAGNWL